MATASDRQTAELARLLQHAVIKCSERCLYQSAKWAAELLNSLPQSAPASPTDTEVDSPMSQSGIDKPIVLSGVVSQQDDLNEARLEAAESHKYLMAQTFFNCREYDRCAAVFLPDTLPRGQIHEGQSPKVSKQPKPQRTTAQDATAASSLSNKSTHSYAHLSEKALFLALYAKYIAGAKRKDEESEMILGPLDGSATTNKELATIMGILEARLLTNDGPSNSQGWLEYLHGIILLKSKNSEEAKRWLVRSLNMYAFNWGVWQELGQLITSTDELDAILPHLPQNLMTLIFHVVTLQQLYQPTPSALSSLKQLKTLFPTSSFLKTQKALLYYHGKDFEKSSHIFSKLIARDAFRLDDLDTYSNILYVMEKRPQLAYLAHLVTAVDRFRPESACVVGNYYALKSEHEKAITYFRRALTLDRSFLSAWTLMGHEYVELKNTQAAIECYRRAVDCNRKDYRAWYGLGQTYEVLEMHLYALWYYQRAAALCPYDAKMWTAVGSCLAKMGRAMQAIKAYKRALEVGCFYEGNASSSFGSQATATPHAPAPDKPPILDPDVLYAIASMYDILGNRDEVHAYLELVLAQEEGTGAERNKGSESDDEETPEERLLRSSIGSVGGGGGGAASSTSAVGVGVTATTSRARLWLAKMEVERGGKVALGRAMELANELCQDGWEVEDAKAMVREVKARLEKETRP